jgi:hypothetical protein
LETYAAEELWTQCIFAAVAKDFGAADAWDMFPRVYYHDVGSSMDSVGEESGGMNALSATK